MLIRPQVVIKATPLTTHLSLCSTEGERVRAALPPPGMQPLRALPLVLGGLALWLGRPLSVVLCADERVSLSALGICDENGVGRSTRHYEVQVRPARRGRRGLGEASPARPRGAR